MSRPANRWTISKSCMATWRAESSSLLQFGTVGKDGKFRLTVPAVSSYYPNYQVQIEKEGYAPAVSSELNRKSGNQALTFRLRRGTGPSGVVLLPEGQPAANATVLLCTSRAGVTLDGPVHLERRPDNTSYRAATDQSGRFYLPAVIDPQGLVVVHERGYAELRAGARDRRTPDHPPAVGPDRRSSYPGRTTGRRSTRRRLQRGSRLRSGRSPLLLCQFSLHDSDRPRGPVYFSTRSRRAAARFSVSNSGLRPGSRRTSIGSQSQANKSRRHTPWWNRPDHHRQRAARWSPAAHGLASYDRSTSAKDWKPGGPPSPSEKNSARAMNTFRRPNCSLPPLMRSSATEHSATAMALSGFPMCPLEPMNWRSSCVTAIPSTHRVVQRPKTRVGLDHA